MKIKLLHIVFLFLITNIMFSQDEQSLLQKNREFQTIGVVENFSLLDRMNNNTLQNNQNSIQENSYVTISQIGNYNVSNVNIRANSSQINIEQYGFNNVVDIDKSANQLKESIFQSGNNNYIQDQSYYSNQNISNQFRQQGDHLSLYNYGSNSISDSISVLQTGSQKSVIIISN